MYEYESASRRRIDEVMARVRSGTSRYSDMSEQQKEHLLDRPGPKPWGPEDVREALVDGLLTAAGCAPENMHPLAEQQWPNGAGFTNAVDAILKTRGLTPEYEKRVPTAMSTGDMPDLLSAVANGISEARSQRYLPKIRKLSRDVFLPTFLPGAYVTADVDELPTPSYGTELRDLAIASINYGSERVQVASAATRMMVSRHLITNNDFNSVTAGIATFADSAYRTEWKMAVDVFSNNPKLSDGDHWFRAPDNVVSDAPMTVTGLSRATMTLRSYPTESGVPCDLDPRLILCGSEQEADARILAAAVNEDVEVIASTHLEDDTWFLMAGPDALARCTLQGSGGDSVWSEAGDDDMRNDGVGFRLRHDVGFHPVSRVGVVRCEIPPHAAGESGGLYQCAPR